MSSTLTDGLFLAYVDLGQGLPFSSLAAIIAAFAAGIGILGLYLRHSWNFFKERRPLVLAITIVLCSAALVILLVRIGFRRKMEGDNKLIVIGMDGLSPDIMERLMKAGRLPNFSRLAEEGSYRRLQTTNPPQSPVVWSTFATGLPPAEHGLFDFVRRDPETYALSLATASESFRRLPRKGKAFWKVLSEKDVPVRVFFCPVTFPPEKVNGVMVSGMGVPDMRGSPGTHFFYTTRREEAQPASSENESTHAGKLFVVEAKDGFIEADIPGLLTSSGREVSVPFRIGPATKRNMATLSIQGRTVDLKENSWSPWVRLTFKESTFRRVSGIVRFFLKEVSPELSLYVSPVEFDPENPPFPISYPKDYSQKLAAEIGLFHTRGMPYETKALEAGRIGERAFLEHAKNVLAERKKILDQELARFPGGLLFFYFEFPDPIQHMFWRFEDKNHPSYTEEGERRFGNVIEECYEEMDRIVGDVVAKMPEGTSLMVLSDHGFVSFRKAVNLNTWLAREGFLALKSEAEVGRPMFENVDWQRTRAYACGLNSLYLNRKGREGQGALSAEACEAVAGAIKTKLEKLRDPETDEPIVEQVYVIQDPGGGPDLIVGYRPPYRGSWQTALGATPKDLLETNQKKWSGDHCVDAGYVPGVLFFNAKDLPPDPRMADLASMIINALLGDGDS